MKKRLNEAESMAIALAGTGQTQRSISAATGLSQPTVSRLSQKHKDIIATQQARLIEQTLTTIADRTIREVQTANAMDCSDKDNQEFLKRVDAKELTLLKSVGIAPSHAPSIHIQQIYNDHSKTLLSPVIADMLSGKLVELTDYTDANEAEET